LTAAAMLFPGPAGMVASAAVKAALQAGLSGNASLLFGRISSFNGAPFWELRCNLARVFGVCPRTISRYFRALVDAGLLVNKPSPLDARHPGLKFDQKLPFRPWYKWAIGLPELREAVKLGSREAYSRWRDGFEQCRQARVTRAKLGAVIGAIVGRKSSHPQPRAAGSCAASTAPPRRWSPAEIEAELDRRTSEQPPPEGPPPDTS
jgi:hypothetical protein